MKFHLNNIVVITNPDNFQKETDDCNWLFDNGLQTLHLRKPKADKNDYIEFLKAINDDYKSRIVIHNYFELANDYNLKGVHLNTNNREVYRGLPAISTSCHSFDEVEQLEPLFNYCFLSPIFNSISKNNYPSTFGRDELKALLPQQQLPIYALGGVTAHHLSDLAKWGFEGAALLGAIWNHPDGIMKAWQNIKNNCNFI